MLDFISIVNKHTYSDLSWFFHEWVDINEIPYYIFGYKTDKTYDGKYKITARIRQINVPEDFQVSMPIVVYFEKEKYKIMRLNFIQPFSEFEFPPFDLKPIDIQLNIFQSVLCQIERNGFRRIDKNTRPFIFEQPE